MSKNRVRLPMFKLAMHILKGSMSTDEFAKKLGIARATVGFYISGERVPDAVGVVKIAEACNVSTDWLLGLSPVKSRDMTVSQVCEATGLTEDSVGKLNKKVSYRTTYSDVINDLVSDPMFGDIVDDIGMALLSSFEDRLYSSKENKSVPCLSPEIQQAVEDQGLSVVSHKDARNLYILDATLCAKELIDKIVRSRFDQMIKEKEEAADGK